ncbi:tRNA (guanosine(37)-N1)-methyltransferase TrmD [Alkalibacterium pelagium]|uniref:tRNA (guanine-N(1)-)-methyltransferase n=1 Tax=Alkalibacterium pelagium TaxID=426702 RepID=A0A1H7JVU0_9LACT|nr:tRNA (guanosine(37)-N1)-methyltransferase TrmD [Alkalibacterium pelagium]GEN50541.1 tRNA (guanine-N(1)-)-methyltransferase [Alkalibacterium pelagium]SEK78190.1 tRNA (guanine37-N1)-methyltransferase [Alkalibacterium pelagium]
MKIDVVTLFPEMFDGPLGHSIVSRAIDKGIVEVNRVNFRQFGKGKHQVVDDTPYGGGAGMLLKPEPLFDAMESIEERSPETKKRVILMDPAGKPFNQAMAEDFSEEEHLVFLCGHYEGYDERIRSLVTDEVSLGDYVLTGGELAAMVMIDASVRLLPNVLGNAASAQTDSHSSGLLEHPHYTRPAEYKGMGVPDVLMSGNHAKIDEWRHKESLKRTYFRRPDMLESRDLTKQEQQWIKEFQLDQESDQ